MLSSVTLVAGMRREISTRSSSNQYGDTPCVETTSTRLVPSRLATEVSPRGVDVPGIDSPGRNCHNKRRDPGEKRGHAPPLGIGEIFPSGPRTTRLPRLESHCISYRPSGDSILYRPVSCVSGVEPSTLTTRVTARWPAAPSQKRRLLPPGDHHVCEQQPDSVTARAVIEPALCC